MNGITSIKFRLQRLIQRLNLVTGMSDDNLTSALESLLNMKNQFCSVNIKVGVDRIIDIPIQVSASVTILSEDA